MINFNKLILRLPLHSRWGLALKTVPLVAVIVLLKFAVHYWGYEFLTISSLFTAIISANIFLIGFLVSGTLVDFKESEKLPGDLSACMDTMADECLIIYKNKQCPEARDFLTKLAKFNNSLIDWFHKKERTERLMQKLRSFNDDFLALEGQTQANFIARLKQEQNTIRRILVRVHTIRGTSFLGPGYAITEIITFVLIVGLIFIKMDPFYESVFFVSFVSFILIYMIRFIKDVDNPFEYDEQHSSDDEISLKPLISSGERLETYCKELS